MPEVEAQKQPNWGGMRDKQAQGGGAGGLDGAHIPAPMPYLMHAGRITPGNQPVRAQGHPGAAEPRRAGHLVRGRA